MPDEPTRMDLLEMEISLRIRWLWEDLFDEDLRPHAEKVASIARAAYGQGYVDCLKEKEPGELCRRFGYELPKKQDLI